MINKTLLKTISYAAMHMTNAIVIAYLLSGSWKVALAIGLVEPCVQTVGYYFHERAWHRWESRHHKKDHHNSVIDSVSPAGASIEKVLRHKS
ncbi:MAG TPA: hypothetical protein DCY07_05300 [Rhodospirillaceae bacterium]|nr:hypothetical protein [Rhodospirillaceae bacterium]